MMRGWAKVGNSRKYHYFIIEEGKTGGTSLCGQWLLLNTNEEYLDDSKHDHEENCASCKRKRARLEGE